MTNARQVGARLRELRKRAGLTQRDVAQHAACKTTRVAHAEQGAEILTAELLRAIASAVDATALETVEVIAKSAMSRRRAVVSVEGLTELQVRLVVQRIEVLRRLNGQPGACVNCDAGPRMKCMKGCPLAKRKGVRHG